MIEIVVFRKDKQIEGFRISGHSKLARKGADICCAAVSAISQTALVGLLNHLEIKPEYEIRDGWLEVRLQQTCGEVDKNQAQIILATMEAGLQMIADDYSRVVKIRSDQTS